MEKSTVQNVSLKDIRKKRITKNTMRIKCPYCGSTAQPRLVNYEKLGDDFLIIYYKCGCGEEFKSVFKHIGFWKKGES